MVHINVRTTINSTKIDEHLSNFFVEALSMCSVYVAINSEYITKVINQYVGRLQLCNENEKFINHSWFKMNSNPSILSSLAAAVYFHGCLAAHVNIPGTIKTIRSFVSFELANNSDLSSGYRNKCRICETMEQCVLPMLVSMFSFIIAVTSNRYHFFKQEF